MNYKQRIAIVPGSFDPVTKGHMSIILKAAAEYDKVFVAVMINPNKEYMFSINQRRLIAEACVRDLKNVTVISSEGWLWQLAQELEACAILKGYRNDVDLKYELEMAEFNEKHYPKGKTVLIKSEDCLEHVSSTAVRELIRTKSPLDKFVPQPGIDIIKSIKYSE